MPTYTAPIDNFRFVLEQTQFLTFVKNSLIIVAFTITGHVVSGSLVAYGFARFRFPAKNVLFLVLLGTLMIPFHAYMIPRFMIANELSIVFVDTSPRAYSHMEWLTVWCPPAKSIPIPVYAPLSSV